MQQTERTTNVLLPIFAVCAVILWCIGVNVIGYHTWGYGALTFCMLLMLAGLVVGAKFLTARVPSISTRATKIISIVVALLALGASIRFVTSQYALYQMLAGQPLRSDIAMNTLMADVVAFELHDNPYAVRTQTGHKVEGSPNVTIENGQVEMYGVPYYYGYPYFPAMFLTYDPFRRVIEGMEFLRTGNAFFYALLVIATGWLAGILAPKGFRAAAACVAIAAVTCTYVLQRELFVYCVTDFVIPVFVLFGFIALQYKRFTIAGLLIGWAFACKLIPGAIIVLVLTLWIWRNPNRWKFIIPMVGIFLLALAPYVFSNPPAFLSATILYYLTEHARGDSTALWYFLPSGFQPVFQLVGYAAVLAIIYFAGRRKNMSLLGVLATCFIANAIFIAFNRMMHLNYVWAIAPIGAVALAAACFAGQLPEPNQQAIAANA